MSLKILLLVGLVVSNPIGILHKQNNHYNISGILDVKNGTKVFLVIPSPEYLIDSTIINEKQFHFKGKIEEPTEATIVLNNLRNLENAKKAKRFSLEPREIKIYGDTVFFQKSALKGSKHNDDIDNYYNFISTEFRQLGYYNKKNNNAAQGNFSKVRDSLTLIFAEKNPDSYKSAMEVFFLRKRIPFESLKDINQKLTVTAKSHYFGKLLSKFVENYHELNLGSVAPNFTLPTVSNDTISLSSYRGKFVLISFWGTWCVPCQVENKHLNELHKTYSNRGLEVIGVALDSKEDLKRVTDQKALRFPNVYTGNLFNSPLMYQYGVTAVPSNILIDKDGIIVAQNLIIQLPDGRFEPIFEKILKK